MQASLFAPKIYVACRKHKCVYSPLSDERGSQKIFLHFRNESPLISPVLLPPYQLEFLENRSWRGSEGREKTNTVIEGNIGGEERGGVFLFGCVILQSVFFLFRSFLPLGQRNANTKEGGECGNICALFCHEKDLLKKYRTLFSFPLVFFSS